MTYITVRQSPFYHQMTLEELLLQGASAPIMVNSNETNTRTYEVEMVSDRFLNKVDVNFLIRKLEQYNEANMELRERDRHSLYHTFFIPKKSGGLRKINAPEPELMNALRQLKTIFEENFHALYHTNAFAYIHGRCTVDAVKRHQQNESKWFAKLDLHDFFGSTTLDYVMSMFGMVFPFSEVIKVAEGKKALREALDLAFLDGGLPQGTPISPLITNIMMIPVDYRLANGFRGFEKQNFVYTRYADDFIISSRYDFDVSKVEGFVVDTLASFQAPFTLNKKKTRYGSSAGRNWNLGVMLNKDNKITVGSKRKRQMQTMLFNYAQDKKNGVGWPREDVMVMNGMLSYCRMVEREAMNGILKHMNDKLGVDIACMIHEDLR